MHTFPNIIYQQQKLWPSTIWSSDISLSLISGRLWVHTRLVVYSIKKKISKVYTFIQLFIISYISLMYTFIHPSHSEYPNLCRRRWFETRAFTSFNLITTAGSCSSFYTLKRTILSRIVALHMSSYGHPVASLSSLHS